LRNNYILLTSFQININIITAPRVAYEFVFTLLIHLIFSQIKPDVMNVNIQTVHFDADTKLVSYIEKKVSKLNQYHDNLIKIDVYLKLDNIVHKIKDKVAEIKVLIPRYEFFVKQSSKSFEESFDLALDSLINQIKRKKQKQAA